MHCDALSADLGPLSQENFHKILNRKVVNATKQENAIDGCLQWRHHVTYSAGDHGSWLVQ